LLLVAVGLGATLTGCALPSEQLALPGPITGSINGQGSGTTEGVPLSDAPDHAAREVQVYEGSGQFVAGDGQAFRGRAGGARVTDDGVTLNFVQATIPEVAKTVLGDVLKLNYAISDGLDGKITLRTSSPIAREDLLDVFSSLLAAEGAALVADNGIYRIVPGNSGSSSGLARGGGGQRGGVQSVIIPLKYVSAQEMERIISSVAPQSAIARVDQDRNLLIVSGIPNELASIRETVAAFDVDWMKGMSFALFPVESADPVAVAQELDTIFANDRDSPTRGIVRFVPNKRLKSVLVISSRPEYLAKAEGWLKRVDLVGQANEDQVHVYRVQNRPAAELAKLLQKVYTPLDADRQLSDPLLPPGTSSTTLSSDSSGDFTSQDRSGAVTAIEPQPIPSFAPAFGGTDNVTATSRIGRSGASPVTDGEANAGLATAGDSGLVGARSSEASLQDQSTRYSGPDDRTSGIQVVADESNNTIIITATAREYNRIQEILSHIDIPPAQVLLEATIAEITLNDQLRFGLRWFFEKKASQFSLTDDVLGAVAPSFPGFSYFLNMPNIQVALNALADVTDVNVVSSPSLMVLDNKRALLQIGDEVPIATQSAVSVTAPGAPIVNSVSFRNTGVILSITPRIGENGRVLLEIEQEVSDVVPTTTSNIDSPTIQQRRIKTTVAVASGESIVLAGFMQDRATKARQQVPLLGDVPFVGNLFKDKNDQIRRTELLIAITPQVINDPSQLRGVAAEFRDRLNFRTRPQRQAPPDRREQIDRVIVR